MKKTKNKYIDILYIHRERKNQKRERESKQQNERHKSEIVTVREIEK